MQVKMHAIAMGPETRAFPGDILEKSPGEAEYLVETRAASYVVPPEEEATGGSNQGGSPENDEARMTKENAERGAKDRGGERETGRRGDRKP